MFQKSASKPPDDGLTSGNGVKEAVKEMNTNRAEGGLTIDLIKDADDYRHIKLTCIENAWKITEFLNRGRIPPLFYK